MTFATSRNFVLPRTPDGLGNNNLWFNMWTKRLWPYKELDQGETLLWYESPNRRIVWRSNVVDVIRFPYAQKKDVADRLELSAVAATQPYFVDAPGSGVCLAYTVDALERLDLPKPSDFRFPQCGWLRLNDDVANNWPELAPYC